MGIKSVRKHPLKRKTVRIVDTGGVYSSYNKMMDAFGLHVSRSMPSPQVKNAVGTVLGVKLHECGKQEIAAVMFGNSFFVLVAVDSLMEIDSDSEKPVKKLEFSKRELEEAYKAGQDKSMPFYEWFSKRFIE